MITVLQSARDMTPRTAPNPVFVCISECALLYTVQCSVQLPYPAVENKKTNACDFYRTKTATPPPPPLRCSTYGDGDREGTTAKVHSTRGLFVTSRILLANPYRVINDGRRN